MAVALDANSTADSTANGVTTRDLTTLTVGSGSNRAVVCQVCWSGTTTSPSLTWDQGGSNQAMAQITGAAQTSTDSTTRVELWGLVAPTSGAKTLRASWTTARDVVLNAVAWTGVDQTGGATSFPHGTGNAGTSTTPSVTVTSAVNNAVMAVHANAVATFSAVNQTQTFIDNTPATMSTAGNRAAGAASVSMTGTISSGQVWSSAGADLAASVTATRFFLMGRH